MKQKKFDDLPTVVIPTIINAAESHMALVFVLDVSSSMEGQPIDQLNLGLNRFKEEVCRDKLTRDILDVAIIQFHEEFSVVQDFVPIEYMETIRLKADGRTKYTEPIREALKMVDERSRFYRRSGSEPFKPWILLVTDGAPMDDITDVANEVKAMQDADKVRLIALGVGDFDPEPLKLLTDVIFQLDGMDFSSYFNWVNKSMRAISTSTPGEKPLAPSLEGDISRYTGDVF